MPAGGAAFRESSAPSGRRLARPVVLQERSGMDDTALQRLHGALQRHIDSGAVPGMVALVWRAGGPVWFEALGARTPGEGGAPMTRDAVFRIYSMTKPIVSLATLMLVEQGRLLLSDPVGRYLPSFRGQRVQVVGEDGRLRLEPARRDATVQDLLRHTAGLGYGRGEGAVARAYRDAGIGARERTDAEMAAALGALPLLRQPGSAWEYSRATDALGALLEVAADEPLDALLQRLVLRPLAMRDTGFSVPPAAHDRVAEPFARDPQTGEAISLLDVRSPAPFLSGGGGLASTAEDYARFLALMLGGGSFGGVRLASRRTVAFMTADHLGGIPATGEVLAAGYGFGLGVAVRRAAGVAARAGAPGQYGWSGIGGTLFFVDPQEDLFALLLMQAPGQLDRMCELYPNLVYAAV
jgi:CubicO group peptidase (beta-lactamase class C family)